MHVMHQACGVTFLDTSDVYGPFTNEELVGAIPWLLGVQEYVGAALPQQAWPQVHALGLCNWKHVRIRKHVGHAQIELPTLAFRNVWDKKPTDWLVVCLVSTRASWPSLILPDLNLHDIVHKVDAVVTNSGHVLT